MHGVADVIVEAHDATHDNLLLRNERIQLRRQHGLLVVDAIRDHEPTTTRESDADVSREERSSNRAINEPVSLLCSIGTRLNELDRNDLNQRLAGVLVVGDLGDRALVQVSHRGSERARRERGRCEGDAREGSKHTSEDEEQRQPERERETIRRIFSRELAIAFDSGVRLCRLPRSLASPLTRWRSALARNNWLLITVTIAVTITFLLCSNRLLFLVIRRISSRRRRSSHRQSLDQCLDIVVLAVVSLVSIGTGGLGQQAARLALFHVHLNAAESVARQLHAEIACVGSNVPCAAACAS